LIIVSQIEEQISSLKENIEPVPQIKAAWAETVERPKQILSESTIFQYTQTFPCLQTSLTIDLVSALINVGAYLLL